MSRIILFLIATIFSGSAVAEWTQIGDYDANISGAGKGRGVKTFVRADGIGKNGDRVVMWTLRDYAAPLKVEGKKQLSSISLEEYDCKNIQYKTLVFYWYPQYKARGRAVYSDINHGDIQPIIPNSLVHDAWKIACGKEIN